MPVYETPRPQSVFWGVFVEGRASIIPFSLMRKWRLTDPLEPIPCLKDTKWYSQAQNLVLWVQNPKPGHFLISHWKIMR